MPDILCSGRDKLRSTCMESSTSLVMKNYPFYRLGLILLLILIPALMISGCAAQWDVTRADVLFQDGIAEAHKGEYQQAIANMEESARIYEKAGNIKRAGWAYSRMSGFSRQRGNLQKALDYAQKALELQKQAAVFTVCLVVCPTWRLAHWLLLQFFLT